MGMHQSGRVPKCASTRGLLDRAAGLVLLGTHATWPLSAHARDSSHSVLQAESSLLQPKNRIGRTWLEGPLPWSEIFYTRSTPVMFFCLKVSKDMFSPFLVT